jgi:hypothetical protein
MGEGDRFVLLERPEGNQDAVAPPAPMSKSGTPSPFQSAAVTKAGLWMFWTLLAGVTSIRRRGAHEPPSFRRKR